MKLHIEIDSARAQQAFERAPRVMNKHLGLALDRAAEEVAREARQAAPKAFSTLAQSIRAERDGELARIVAPGVNYARPVEEGTKPGKMPPREALLPWLKQKTGATGRELRNRSFLLARYIQRHGTKAHPYMEPTVAKMRPRVLALLIQGRDRGVQEILG